MLNSYFLSGIILSAAIFSVDLTLPLGVAAAVPYIAPVLLSFWSSDSRHIWVMAILGTTLTLLGYLLSSPGGIPWMVIFNRALALFAIWTTAVLI